MTAATTVFTPEQQQQLHQAGWTAFGKRVHARIERNRQRLYHSLFGSKRYVVFVEHQSTVIDENGEPAEPVLGIIVTAPNIRAARRQAIEQFPGHIRRFLHWKELPLYPTDGEEVA